MDSARISPPSLNQHYGRLLSCSLPCKDLSLSGFLAAAEGQPRYYWENQNDSIAFAGAGTAVELMAWGENRYRKIEDDARELFADALLVGEGTQLAGPRLFGGFAFRDDFTPDNTWAIYTPAYFVLPHYQLTSLHGQMWLTINTQIPLDEKPETLIPDLKTALQEKMAQLKAREGLTAQRTQSDLLNINYPRSYAIWERMINEATRRIRAGELQKVVLAREAELQFAAPIRILPVLRYLAMHYAECYRFLFEPRPHYAFYGASPELLVSMTGKRVETMGLAGSIRRGASPAEDERFGQQLLGSEKDRHEYQIVVDKLRDRLSPLTASLEIPPVSLFKLSNIQHLYTPICGSLHRETGILPLIEALHPSPALGGDPRLKAMALIRELERIPRGWYGAPVGWIDSQLEGEFAVAIRSAVAQDRRVWIYAGAGIVADSVPQLEWEETALKFRPMLDAHASEGLKCYKSVPLW